MLVVVVDMQKVEPRVAVEPEAAQQVQRVIQQPLPQLQIQAVVVAAHTQEILLAPAAQAS
jgi:hypothetical protein